MKIPRDILNILSGTLNNEAGISHFACRYSENRRLRELLHNECLTGYACEVFIRNNLLSTFQSSIRDELSEIIKTTVMRQKWLISETEALADIFSKYKTSKKFILLKGIPLLKSLYRGREYVRTVSDIDILIPGGTYDDLKILLLKEGYKTAGHYQNCFIRNKTVLDIHNHIISDWRVPSRSRIFPGLEDDFINRALPVRELPFFYRFSPLDEWLYLSIHFLFHHGCKDIRWGVELVQYLNSFQDHFDEKNVYPENLNKMAGCVIYFLERYLGLKSVPNVLKKSMNKTPRALKKLFIKTSLVSPGKDVRYIYPLFFFEGYKNRVRYIKEIIFPYRNSLLALYPNRKKTPYPVLLLKFWKDVFRKVTLKIRK